MKGYEPDDSLLMKKFWDDVERGLVSGNLRDYSTDSERMMLRMPKVQSFLTRMGWKSSALKGALALLSTQPFYPLVKKNLCKWAAGSGQNVKCWVFLKCPEGISSENVYEVVHARLAVVWSGFLERHISEEEVNRMIVLQKGVMQQVGITFEERKMDDERK